LSSFSQKKFERARSRYLLDKLTGKLNNPDYFVLLSRSMAELNGYDTPGNAYESLPDPN